MKLPRAPIRRRSVAASACLSALLLMSTGVPLSAQQPRIGPNGDGTLLREDDRRWEALQDVRVNADFARGQFVATFGPALARSDGTTVRITGYILPVEAATHSSHFVITRRSASCPFCAPPGLTEAVEVFAVAPIAYSADPITLQGRLHLVGRSDAGLFYRLDQAGQVQGRR